MPLQTVTYRVLLQSALRSCYIQQTAAASHGHGPPVPSIKLAKIGNREIVGYGLNGDPSYIDKVDIPMPAIRFMEVTPDIQALREKEKGDWKKLTLEEKKALYRASFCQTFAEMKAPTGEWKGVVGMSLIVISIALSLYLLMKLYVYSPMPASFDPESQKLQLKRLIDIRANPIDGIASKWDYETGKWK